MPVLPPKGNYNWLHALVFLRLNLTKLKLRPNVLTHHGPFVITYFSKKEIGIFEHTDVCPNIILDSN